MKNNNKKYSAVNRSDINKLFHEIKNPLAICNGYIEIMKKNYNCKYLDIINSELKRINQILIDYQNTNNVKDIINIYNLLNDIKNIIEGLYNKQNIYLEIDCLKDLKIIGNYNQLKQVFINIFKNAQESKDKNILLIKVKVTKLKEKIKIEVSDNGKGMSKEQLQLIGKEYYTTKNNGTGLGVPFILETIKKHNGTINYESYETKGTKIIMRLPLLTN